MKKLLTFEWLNDFGLSRTHITCFTGAYVSGGAGLLYLLDGEIFKALVGSGFAGLYLAIGSLRAAITKRLG